MRLQILSLLLVVVAGPALSQDAAFPLESVVTEGSSIPQPVILEMAGLKIASPVSKATIEQACQKLQDTGLFASINYRYAPGPKKGYAVTLSLADQPLVAASIDVPGADENETWKWLSAKFHRFDHQAPQPDPGQRYLGNEIEQHLGSQMRGQHITARLETDLYTRKLLLSFQPEVLPRIQSVAFKGNQQVGSSELSSVLNPIVTNAEYTARKLTGAVELNLRPVYEQHGLYRVQFAAGGPQLTDAGVSVTVAITEGAPYQLGKVELDGENLPVPAMFTAAKFPNGKLANWKQIQDGIWEAEKVVKRTGFFEASGAPTRSYDDTAHVLDLHVRISKGPLYHFGEVRFVGLSSDLQERARRMWKAKPGDNYDYEYPNEFFREFSRTVDFRNFRKFEAKTQSGAGDHVMDVSLIFEPK